MQCLRIKLLDNARKQLKQLVQFIHDVQFICIRGDISERSPAVVRSVETGYVTTTVARPIRRQYVARPTIVYTPSRNTIIQS